MNGGSGYMYADESKSCWKNTQALLCCRRTRRRARCSGRLSGFHSCVHCPLVATVSVSDRYPMRRKLRRLPFRRSCVRTKRITAEARRTLRLRRSMPGFEPRSSGWPFDPQLAIDFSWPASAIATEPELIPESLKHFVRIASEAASDKRRQQLRPSPTLRLVGRHDRDRLR